MNLSSTGKALIACVDSHTVTLKHSPKKESLSIKSGSSTETKPVPQMIHRKYLSLHDVSVIPNMDQYHILMCQIITGGRSIHVKSSNTVV